MELVTELKLEIPFGFLYQQATKSAFDKLMRASFDGKTAYNIKKIYDSLDKNFKSVVAVYDAALKEFCELDADGKIIEPDGPGSFKVKDGQWEAWQAKVKEIMDQKFTIEKVTKIPLKELVENPSLQMSGVDYTALEPVLDGLDYTL